MAEHDLGRMLSELSPVLVPGEFVFCHIPYGRYGDFKELEPVASFVEAEGLSLVLPRQRADMSALGYDGAYRCISLGVHSSLEAVGLTAWLSRRLAEIDVPANVVAAYHHDHIFVPAGHAKAALAQLTEHLPE